MSLPSLTGKLVKLRAVEPEDLEWHFQWENDMKLWQVSNTIVPFSRFVLRAYLETAHKDIFENKQLRLMIDTIDLGETVGAIDLFDFDPFHLRAGVGVLIGAESDRRQGLAAEALQLLIKYSQETLKLHQLYCNISKQNVVSLKLFQKCGFAITGEKTDWLRTMDGWENEYVLQLKLK